MRRSARLLFAVAPPVAAAVVGSLAARDAAGTYQRLVKPAWAPPAAVFGPVWSVLYALNGVAGWRVAGWPRDNGAAWHLLQLGLNASWTPVFFGARRRRAALAVSALLDLAVLAEVGAAWREGDRTTAAVLAPYLAWTGFATALTAAVRQPATVNGTAAPARLPLG